MSEGTILVTGGAGYVGSHACKALARAGYRPVVYDNLERGHRDAVLWGPLEEGDLRDAARLDDVFRQYRPEAVMHFAAYAYVGESCDHPDLYYRNNVGGSLTLLAVMGAHDVSQMIFSSTCAVYGIPDQVPISEGTPHAPVSPYGATKMMVERMLRDMGRARPQWRSVALRYFNACGADPEGEIGENHDPETHLIPRGLMAAGGEIGHLAIFGDDYPTPDGTAVRDYIHVMDLAAGHVAALRHLERGGAGGAFNLGSGQGHSVAEIIAAIERITGRPVPTEKAGRRPGDPPVLVAESGRAQKELGFVCRQSGLDQIISDAWAWYCKRHRPTGS